MSTPRAAAAGAIAMSFVGGSVAVSAVLPEGSLFSGQAVRYAIACAVIAGWMRVTRRQVRRPEGREWLWFLGVALSGLVLFNVALVHGSRHAEPAVLAVAVSAVPIALATVGPVLEGRRPTGWTVLAAVVVTTGAVAVAGTGRCDLAGLVWAVVVFACEACFTLFAVPVLSRHGPAGVSLHTTWLAAALFAACALTVERDSAATSLTASSVIAIGYLAVCVTAVAFVFWYSCVHGLGPARAGLLTGVVPVAAAAAGVPVTGELPAAGVWLGVGLIAIGLALGMGDRPRMFQSGLATIGSRYRRT